MHCHTPHTKSFYFIYYFFYLFFSLFYFLSFVLTSVRRCEAFSLLRNLVPKFSKFRIKVSEASFSNRRTKEDARDSMRCGARVQKKRSPALITRARARRRGGIPDRPGFLRSNARQKLAIAEHGPGQSGGRTGVAKCERGRWGRSSRSDLAQFFFGKC